MRKLTAVVPVIILSLCLSCNNTDEQIVSNIQKRITADPQVQSARITVVVTSGKVTLKGRTTTSAERERIQDIAKTEPGVWTVDDQIIADSVEDPSGVASVIPNNPDFAPPVAKVVIVPAGTVLTIRTKQSLGSQTSQVGTAFTGSLANPIRVRGNLIVPSGSAVRGSVKKSTKAGLLSGKGSLGLGLDSITVTGNTYNIETELYERSGAGTEGSSGRGSEKAAGQGERKRDVDLPAHSALSFRLAQPLKVRAIVR